MVVFAGTTIGYVVSVVRLTGLDPIVVQSEGFCVGKGPAIQGLELATHPLIPDDCQSI